MDMVMRCGRRREAADGVCGNRPGVGHQVVQARQRAMGHIDSLATVDSTAVQRDIIAAVAAGGARVATITAAVAALLLLPLQP